MFVTQLLDDLNRDALIEQFGLSAVMDVESALKEKSGKRSCGGVTSCCPKRLIQQPRSLRSTAATPARTPSPHPYPFKNFNGRVGRILLVALACKLGLPPMDPAAVADKEGYFAALRGADTGDLIPLREIWLARLTL